MSSVPGASSSSSAMTTQSRPSALPPRSLNRQEVLEEDEYTQALSLIIARDFFPSLAHLEATNTFLSSLDSQDPERIQESARRLSDLGQTPVRRSGWAQSTPYASQTPYDTPIRSPRASSLSEALVRPKADTSLSLDAFQAKYTSEDNSSFTEILNDENRAKRVRYAWAWEAERRAIEGKAKETVGRERLLLEATGDPQRLIEDSKSATVQIEGSNETLRGSSGPNEQSEPFSITSTTVVIRSHEPEAPPVDVMARRKDTRSAVVPAWNFKNRNALMFSPDADSSPFHQTGFSIVPSKAEVGSEPKSVIHSATRLPQQSETVPSASVPPSPTRSFIGAAISGVPYARKGTDDTPKVGGFGFVAPLPSPTPEQLGPEAMKELMTWGTLLGTPRVISSGGDDEDSEITAGRARNPFAIAHMSQRDSIGRRLGGQAGKSLREKAALLSTASTPLRKRRRVESTPGGTHGGGGEMLPPIVTPRRTAGAADMLSPAARTLLGRTKTGTAMGLGSTPRVSSSTPASSFEAGGGRGRGRRSKELDLRKVGWSPLASPIPSPRLPRRE